MLIGLIYNFLDDLIRLFCTKELDIAPDDFSHIFNFINQNQ
jgi:hypothetical protein